MNEDRATRYHRLKRQASIASLAYRGFPREITGLVVPVPVRRLHDQCIRTLRRNGLSDNGKAAASDVT
jgi:hypothetical protein